MRNRSELAQLFNKLGFKIGAEVGVFNGYYSETLCKTIPDLELYAIDAWEGYKGYRDHKYASSFNKAYESTVKLLKPFPKAHIVKKFSIDAVKDFSDGSLDFVYIDGNHEYKYVKEDIEIWAPKVHKGGIVAGHDWYVTPTGNHGVINAVSEYVSKHRYNLKLTDWDLDNQSVDNRQPSWYFYA